MEFTLRPWKESDLSSLVHYANNPLIARFMTDQFPHPYTEASGKAFISMASTGAPTNILAIDVNGEAAGGIGIHPQHDVYSRNAEMGYWLGQPFWGRGIVSRAVLQMVAYGFKHWDIDRIFARPFGSNTASQRVLQKAGFILEGRFEKTVFKQGRYEDELIYAVRR